ncbi:MAG TPA: gamma-glutamyl-gamma-aminobutyrate hydrolase family protein [Solirubrobacteraceae bacterium]|nr:gamma-glutamyl-gamma-aminobutyrate hydrolase family protein [Solirubrobacteraceae bacterium]
MSRPLIGICAALERARWSVWDLPALLIPRDYTDAIARAGGRAVILPVDGRASEGDGEVASDGASEVAQILGPLDGVLLAGGADIDPAAYGQAAHGETRDTVPERDAFELAIVRGAIAAGLPVLGICRGMQVINVALGGTLHQHLPDRYGHLEHRRVVGSFEGAEHDVVLAEGSLAARAAGEVVHGIRSHHHQGVDGLGEGLRVSGRSALDGLAEAIELGEGFVLGVQWHPEVDPRSTVIGAFVAAARAHARAGGVRA